MSWQRFVDDSLLGTSQVAKASIHGLDGKRYASSAGFVVRIDLINSRHYSFKTAKNLTIISKTLLKLNIPTISRISP